MDAATVLSILAIVVSGGVALAQVGLKNRLDRFLHVHKATADLEISAYKELWEKLNSLHLAANSLRPNFDYQQNAEVKRQRLETFASSFMDFQARAHQLRPFIPKEIWENITELLHLFHSEGVDYQVGDPKYHEDYWRTARDNRAMIGQAVDTIVDAVRERLNAMSGAEKGKRKEKKSLPTKPAGGAIQ